MAARPLPAPLHSFHIIRHDAGDFPGPLHEADPTNHSAGPLCHARIHETLAAAHRAQWRGLALVRRLRRRLEALQILTHEHVMLVSKTQRLRAHYLRQVFWLQVTAQAQLSWSRTLLHLTKADTRYSVRALLPMSGAGEQLECQIVEIPGVVVVHARGILSFDTAQALEDVLQGAIERGHVVLDLVRVTNIDTSGYGALEHAHQRALQSGRLLLFAGASRRIRRAIEILHIDRDIATFETAEEAVTCLEDTAAAPANGAGGPDNHPMRGPGRLLERAYPAAVPVRALQPVQGGAQDAGETEELRPGRPGPGDAG
ncbi:MAG: STAS domain-containing protein [Bacillati bacterium ANGP1]|uniref:STAS domain-containing protein n=1 Tax=Candidatus Segetimicrobium genomatis TaxID=2569760 RepID=A0A537JA96_9BACT|nr:MAG: STAS domain-containing protein [Terrabacteria group bacterium ANGP1]